MEPSSVSQLLSGKRNASTKVLTQLCDRLTYPIVRDDGYVKVDSKYYRVDPRLKKEVALAIAGQTTVSIYMKGRLLEVYEKITDRFKTKDCKPHYQDSWEKTLEDHGHYLRRARYRSGR